MLVMYGLKVISGDGLHFTWLDHMTLPSNLKDTDRSDHGSRSFYHILIQGLHKVLQTILALPQASVRHADCVIIRK